MKTTKGANKAHTQTLKTSAKILFVPFISVNLDPRAEVYYYFFPLKSGRSQALEIITEQCNEWPLLTVSIGKSPRVPRHRGRGWCQFSPQPQLLRREPEARPVGGDVARTPARQRNAGPQEHSDLPANFP